MLQDIAYLCKLRSHTKKPCLRRDQNDTKRRPEDAVDRSYVYCEEALGEISMSDSDAHEKTNKHPLASPHRPPCPDIAEAEESVPQVPTNCGLSAKRIVALDLDGTLIGGSGRGEPDFIVFGCKIWVRPGAKDLISFCIDHFIVGVFTYGTSEYAAAVVSQLFTSPPAFVFSRNHCYQIRLYYSEVQTIKSLETLSLVELDPSKAILIDDCSSNMRQPDQGIVVPCWYGNGTDTTLFDLKRYLAHIKDLPLSVFTGGHSDWSSVVVQLEGDT